MMTQEERFAAADVLEKAERDRVQATQLSITWPHIDFDDAYAISAEGARRKVANGARIIGRKVSPQWVSDVFTGEVVTLSPDQALASLLSCNVVLDLAERLQLRRTRIMNTPRIELTGFTDVMRDRLTAFGLFHEIIAWKLRMFVPTDAAGEAVLGRLFERYPLLRVAERAGA